MHFISQTSSKVGKQILAVYTRNLKSVLCLKFHNFIKRFRLARKSEKLEFDVTYGWLEYYCASDVDGRLRFCCCFSPLCMWRSNLKLILVLAFHLQQPSTNQPSQPNQLRQSVQFAFQIIFHHHHHRHHEDEEEGKRLVDVCTKLQQPGQHYWIE